MNEVRLFATCLAEQFFPNAIDSTIQVLERLKLKVRVLREVFCCGQAPFNEGLREDALALARKFLDYCPPGLPVIVPSGSCSSMIRIFYGDLLEQHEDLRARAAALRPWVFELSQFLVNVLKVRDVDARFEQTVAYHPSCHLTRELGVRDEPLLLLQNVRGLKLVNFRNPEECCGFGGMFSVKFPEISTAMADDKITRLLESGAQTLVANDCGCLMQMGGAMHRRSIDIKTRHLAEILNSR